MRSRASVVGSVVVAAALGAGAVAASPAQGSARQGLQAQEAREAREAGRVEAPGAVAAMCVKTRTQNKAHGYLVTVTNRCGRTVKVKIVMRWAKDSRCFTLKKGQTRYRETQGIGTWKKTVFC